MKALCFEENDRLDQTEYTQAALVTVCLAWNMCSESGGLSGCHGGIEPGRVLRHCLRRRDEHGGRHHHREKARHPDADRSAGGRGTMAAVLGMTGEAIEKVVDPIDGVSIANYNCPGQIVITGWKESVRRPQRS